MFYAKFSQNFSAFSIVIDTEEEEDFMSAANKFRYSRSS
jgi:hypothetical protein